MEIWTLAQTGALRSYDLNQGQCQPILAETVRKEGHKANMFSFIN